MQEWHLMQTKQHTDPMQFLKQVLSMTQGHVAGLDIAQSPKVGDTVLVEQWLRNEGFSARECRVVSVGEDKVELEEVAAYLRNPDGSIRTLVGNGRRLTCRTSSFETPFEERFHSMVSLIKTMLECFNQTDATV